MSLPKCTIPKLPDRDVQNALEGLYVPLQAILKIPLLDGVLKSDVEVTTSQATLRHGLGRRPLGWILVTKDANANVWEVSRNDTELVLDSSATVTVDVWVF